MKVKVVCNNVIAKSYTSFVRRVAVMQSLYKNRAIEFMERIHKLLTEEMNYKKKELGLKVLIMIIQISLNKGYKAFVRILREIYGIRRIRGKLLYKVILRQNFNYFRMKIGSLMKYNKSLNRIIMIGKKNIMKYYFNTIRKKVKYIKKLNLLRRVLKSHSNKYKQRYVLH